jgi:murein DD-endopeptidase MepM/ murein hydrolase activator NlpD
MPTNTPVAVVQHLLLGRPVPPDARGLSPDRTYLYGSTQQGNQVVHHGEEFVNPAGTPIIAVADGVVVTAGTDKDPICGPAGDQVCGERLDFYGGLVVVRLDQAYEGQTLFTMCGHMRSIGVKPGEPLGTVGASGVAEGPHCHFEVRVGVNDYAHTRNPILWMRPLPGTGAVAGIVQDRDGKPLYSVNVFLYLDNETQDYVQDTETYGRDDHPAVNSDDRMHENWAFGDVPTGKYILRVTIGSLSYLRHITIEEGKLLFVVFGGP